MFQTPQWTYEGHRLDSSKLAWLRQGRARLQYVVLSKEKIDSRLGEMHVVRGYRHRDLSRF